MIWVLILYLAAGFIFEKPQEWGIFTKTMVHIFWLPVVLIIVLLIRKEGFRVF